MIDLNQSEAVDRLAEVIAQKVAALVVAEARRRFVSREEYAKIHGVGVRTVDRAIKENRLPVRRTGRRVLIDANATIDN